MAHPMVDIAHFYVECCGDHVFFPCTWHNPLLMFSYCKQQHSRGQTTNPWCNAWGYGFKQEANRTLALAMATEYNWTCLSVARFELSEEGSKLSCFEENWGKNVIPNRLQRNEKCWNVFWSIWEIFDCRSTEVKWWHTDDCRTPGNTSSFSCIMVLDCASWIYGTSHSS